MASDKSGHGGSEDALSQNGYGYVCIYISIDKFALGAVAWIGDGGVSTAGTEGI